MDIFTKSKRRNTQGTEKELSCALRLLQNRKSRVGEPFRQGKTQICSLPLPTQTRHTTSGSEKLMNNMRLVASLPKNSETELCDWLKGSPGWECEVWIELTRFLLSVSARLLWTCDSNPSNSEPSCRLNFFLPNSFYWTRNWATTPNAFLLQSRNQKISSLPRVL